MHKVTSNIGVMFEKGTDCQEEEREPPTSLVSRGVNGWRSIFPATFFRLFLWPVLEFQPPFDDGQTGHSCHINRDRKEEVSQLEKVPQGAVSDICQVQMKNKNGKNNKNSQNNKNRNSKKKTEQKTLLRNHCSRADKTSCWLSKVEKGPNPTCPSHHSSNVTTDLQIKTKRKMFCLQNVMGKVCLCNQN